ncbi:MAG: hypothetical protein WAM82_20840 [Thermoanaerobaculia bacterium]
MRVFWWDLGLHLKPETKAEHTALLRLSEFFVGLGFPCDDDDLLPLELEWGVFKVVACDDVKGDCGD